MRRLKVSWKCLVDEQWECNQPQNAGAHFVQASGTQIGKSITKQKKGSRWINDNMSTSPTTCVSTQKQLGMVRDSPFFHDLHTCSHLNCRAWTGHSVPQRATAWRAPVPLLSSRHLDDVMCTEAITCHESDISLRDIFFHRKGTARVVTDPWPT